MTRTHRPLSLLLLVLPAIAQTSSLEFLNHNLPVLDAHNCYPALGQWTDRIDRALKTGFPVGIEQDLTWYVDPVTGEGRAVVSHTAKTTGVEPTLRDYFFERVRPIVEKALAGNDRAGWPLIVVHFDFKSEQPALLDAVWKLLGEYRSWITTATKGADSAELSPFEPKPLLVLTEDSDDQERVFFHRVPVGDKLRLFGSAHTNAIAAQSKEERNRLQASVSPEQLLSGPPTNYRRWWNASWHVVEEGGQHSGRDWTPSAGRRLRDLVNHAHQLGYWIRFYTLDGFEPGEDRGWNETYNFGSHRAVQARWQAAIESGVNLIATDQYEEFAGFMRDR